MNGRRRGLVTAALIALSGCTTSVASGPVSSASPVGLLEAPLTAGDVLVALGDRPRADGTAIVRYRPRGDGAGSRVHAQVLIELDAPVDALAASSGGRWVAARAVPDSTVGSGPRVALWDLHRADLPLTARAAVWTSPPGCSEPRFDPDDRFVVLECPPREGLPGRIGPAHLVLLDLPSLQPLGLVGERDRHAPAVGVNGDLYWVETRRGVGTILRRDDRRRTYPVHRTRDEVSRLWPQHDGSVVVEVQGPVGERELRRFESSGAAVAIPLPRDLGRTPGNHEPVSVGRDGDVLFVSCTPDPCTVLRSAPSGFGSAPLSLLGRPTAVASVPRFGRSFAHVEDLATAPETVFTTHDASVVSVLGVRLGMPLESAFATLDRGRRFPQWIGADQVPQEGIGVGAVRSGHCLEFLADSAGLVAAIELTECARGYLSPALQPLLDREALAGGALPLIRRFLGPGVSAQVGDPALEEPEGPAIEGTSVRYAAPQRGYSFEARTEILSTARARLMNGRLRLRLELPRTDTTLGAR